MLNEELLVVKDLRVSYPAVNGRAAVVENVSFSLNRAEIIGIVGESGCGKSVTSRAIMGMVKNPGQIDRGSILFDGKELTQLSKKEYTALRGKEISMIFQEPMTALNPVYTIGEQMAECICKHLKYNKKEALEYATEMLEKVGISMPKDRLKQYPYELSGGMRQRVMIAICLSCHPKLLIADEPTTALDVTIQAQILRLMQELCKSGDMSTIVVTHDMGVVSELCSRVIVMYAGNVVETGASDKIFKKPLHPYTKALLKSIPKIGEKGEKLYAIPGTVIAPGERSAGCRFSNRCECCRGRCKTEMPPTITMDGGRTVKCWLYENARGE